eukprot:XP_001695969.1 predicted protein [Chlamydomonas reinhardtii]
MGDTLLASSLFAARLPSPSVLTGNYAPQTAGIFVEQALQESQRRAAGSRLATPAAGASRGNAEEVGALRSLASRHLGTLGRGMGMGPFQPPPQPLTPKGRLPAAALQPGPQPPRSISTPPLRCHTPDLNLSARPGSRMGPPPGTPPSRSHLGTGSSSFSATGRTNLPGNASPLRGGYRHTVTKRLIETVFQELDEYDSGRLTYSAFEQAACRIGMRPTQARRLFDQLDPEGHGYTTVKRWVDPVVERQMEQLIKLYVQATRGEDGRPKHVNEIGSIHMAVQLAMNKLKLKRCGRAVSIERLIDAFKFIDRDASGALSLEELEDALNALGIFVTRDVLDTMMHTFDKDGNGGVDYLEFVHSLFPNEASNISSSSRAH